MHVITKSAIGLFCLGLSCSAATTLYDLSSTVLDGNAGENTYISANGTGSGLAYTSGATPSLQLTLPNSGSYAELIVNFPLTSLTTIGDSITLSYSFTVSSATAFSSANDQVIRVGLFNSNGSPFTGDGNGTDTNAKTHIGYAAMYRATGTPTANDTFYQRNSTAGTALMSTSSFSNTALDGTPPTLPSLGITSSSLAVTGSFTVSLISGGVQLTSTVNGVTQTVTDTTGSVVTSFDEFALFGLSNAANPTLTFTNLSVTSTSAIPELSSTALFAGLFGLGCVAMLRRKR